MVMASRLTARIERRTDCDLYIWSSFKSLRVKQIRSDLLLYSDSPGLGFSVVGALRNVRHARVLRVQRLRDHFERSERTFGRQLWHNSHRGLNGEIGGGSALLNSKVRHNLLGLAIRL